MHTQKRAMLCHEIQLCSNRLVSESKINGGCDSDLSGEKNNNTILIFSSYKPTDVPARAVSLRCMVHC